MSRGRVVRWLLGEPKNRQRRFIGHEPDCQPVGQAGTCRKAWDLRYGGAVYRSRERTECVMHKGSQGPPLAFGQL